MTIEELTVPLVLALLAGILIGYLLFRMQVAAIEARYRAELERWKHEAVQEIRKDTANRSRSTLKGKIAEQMAPLLPAFRYNPADARFIGSPVDYIIFDGLTDVADEKKDRIRVVFVDVKQGRSDLSRTQRVIRNAIRDANVAWETLRID